MTAKVKDEYIYTKATRSSLRSSDSIRRDARRAQSTILLLARSDTLKDVRTFAQQRYYRRSLDDVDERLKSTCPPPLSYRIFARSHRSKPNRSCSSVRSPDLLLKFGSWRQERQLQQASSVQLSDVVSSMRQPFRDSGREVELSTIAMID